MTEPNAIWRGAVTVGAAIGLVASLTTGCGRGGETVEVVDPLPGTVVELPFVVTVEASQPLGAPDDDLYHLHIWFGEDLDSYLVVEADTVEVVNAPDGEHEMHVSLRKPDHSSAGAEITVPLVIRNVP